MANSNLPRVDDLEKSPQWASLTNEINDLERLCRLNNHRRFKRQPLRYNYYRYSMPQMQKATSVWIESGDELNDDFQTGNDFSKSNDDETNYRWSWRPKTEFERSYFLDYDYDREGNVHPQKRYSPLRYNEPSNENRDSSDRPRNPFDEDKCSVNYDNEAAYSGTRERLHEIFERNRYLRRKFFASMPGNDTAGYDFPKGYESKNPGAVSKYSGFGSTETITSQSNQSSISSNDRKSRCQSNVTPELIEEESCNNDGFSHRASYSKNSSTNVSHVQGGRILSTTRNGKLLVNMAPSGNELYEIKEPTVSVEKEFNSKHDLAEQGGTISRYEPNEDQSEEYSPNLTEDEGNADAGDSRYSRRFQNLKDRRTTRGNCRSNSSISVANRSNGTRHDKSKDWTRGDFGSTSEWTSSLENVCKSLPNLSLYEKSETNNLSTDSSLLSYCTKSATTNVASVRGKPILRRYFGSQMDLSNIRGEPTSLTQRRVKVTKVPPPLDLSRVNETYEEVEALERNRLNHVNVSLVRNYDRPLEGQVAIVRDDTSREDRGQKKSDETSRGNDGRAETVSEVGNYHRRDNADQCQQRMEELSSRLERGLHKSCGDLTATGDLRSPQLVNNYNNSTIDLRASGSSRVNLGQSSQVAGLEAFRERRGGVVPLSDHVNSIGGPQAAGSGSTLPSVYGPIPYSQ